MEYLNKMIWVTFGGGFSTNLPKFEINSKIWVKDETWQLEKCKSLKLRFELKSDQPVNGIGEPLSKYMPDETYSP